MIQTMTAIFENPDAAELALHRVRQQGISVRSVVEEPLDRPWKSKTQLVETPVLFPGIDGRVSATAAPLGSLRGWETVTEPSNRFAGECRLWLTLEQRDAAMAKSVLISNAGRQVR